MDIYIKDLDSGELLRFPSLPEKITTRASSRFLSYDIMNVGEVRLPLGEQLVGFSWEGTLYGEARKNMPFVREWVRPQDMQSKFSIWRGKGSKLLLTITETPINHQVYLVQYECSETGGYGDIEYNIEFVVAKEIMVEPEGQSISSAKATGAMTKPAEPLPKAKSYTVKPGDSMYRIAQQQLGAGSKWQALYQANQTLIDGRNKGKKVDKYTIYPGQVLALPQ